MSFLKKLRDSLESNGKPGCESGRESNDQPKDAPDRKANSHEHYPYLGRCRAIWKRFVPPRGQSNTLQGELLRETEALRYEAQNNGNFNWDEYFSYFCDFIKETLNEQEALPEDMRAAACDAADHIKACGEYDRRFNDGLIPDDELDTDMIACVDDAPYDVIENAIGCMDALVGGAAIPHAPNPAIPR